MLSKCLFVIDKLTNNLPDIFDQPLQPLKEQHNLKPRANTQMVGSNSIKIRSIKD